MGIEEKTSEQLGAITRGIKLGRTLTKEHPKIAELYREGNTIFTIMEELDIQSNYNVGENVAFNGVYRAITGHGGGFGLNSYEGLIPNPEEREKLGIEHRQEGGRKGGREGVIARGLTPWGESKQIERLDNPLFDIGSEIELAYFLSQCPDHQRGSRVNNKKIADQLNNCYHDGKEVRSPEAVNDTLSKYRKSQGIIAQGKTLWGESKQIERLDNPLFDIGSEIELAYFLSQCPDHQRGSRVNNKKIADQLNYFYHDGKEVRTPGTVHVNLYNYRKSLDDEVNDGN